MVPATDACPAEAPADVRDNFLLTLNLFVVVVSFPPTTLIAPA
jgi:hypothetical protein